MERRQAARPAAFSLLALPAAVALTILSSLIWPAADDGPLIGLLVPLAVLVTPPAVALLVWGRPVIATVVVSALVLLAGTVLGATVGLRLPDRFFDFAAGVVLVAAPLAALVTFFLRRRSRTEPGRLRAPYAVWAVAALAIAGSAVFDVLKGPQAVEAGTAAEVATVQDLFVPFEFAASAGDDIAFRVRNDDSYAHTFSIDALQVDEYLGPLADKTVRFTVDAPAGTTMRLYCAINGHEKMTGTLHVEP